MERLEGEREVPLAENDREAVIRGWEGGNKGRLQSCSLFFFVIHAAEPG